MTIGERIAEDEYVRTYLRWEHTAKWRVLARLRRRREYEMWLRALMREVRSANG